MLLNVAKLFAISATRMGQLPPRCLPCPPWWLVLEANAVESALGLEQKVEGWRGAIVVHIPYHMMDQMGLRESDCTWSLVQVGD